MTTVCKMPCHLMLILLLEVAVSMCTTQDIQRNKQSLIINPGTNSGEHSHVKPLKTKDLNTQAMVINRTRNRCRTDD